MSSPQKNIINTLIDHKNMKNIPDNVNNELVDELIQQDMINEGIYEDSQSNNYENQINNVQMCYSSTEIEAGDNSFLNYTTTNILYSLAFQNSNNCKIAVGTLEKNLNNRIEIVEMDEEGLTLSCKEELEFPCTKLMWSPSSNNCNTLAASSDIIRLYKYSEEDKKLNLNITLNNKKSKYSSPITSFDWNKENNSILGTASIDTTCTIWDLNRNTIRTQLIAHDKEVFDIAFSQDENTFISTGADGSIRHFDLRSLDHSTIIFETKDQTPITKISWNTQNTYLIAALGLEKDSFCIIDTRASMHSFVELKRHSAPVTSMAWAPSSGSHICSVGEDKYVIIWNVQTHIGENVNHGPLLNYKAPHEIYNLNWCTIQPEWIGITFRNQLQLLRI
jgi:WD repeat-containing protein 68